MSSIDFDAWQITALVFELLRAENSAQRVNAENSKLSNFHQPIDCPQFVYLIISSRSLAVHMMDRCWLSKLSSSLQLLKLFQQIKPVGNTRYWLCFFGNWFAVLVHCLFSLVFIFVSEVLRRYQSHQQNSVSNVRENIARAARENFEERHRSFESLSVEQVHHRRRHEAMDEGDYACN